MTDTFRLTQEEYERFRDLVLKRSGLYFPEDKRQALSKGLAEAVALSPCKTLEEYYELLLHSLPTNAEWERLVSLLTVGETYFFRNKAHFDALACHILPGIIARRRGSTRTLRIWSAGCATGEEPYSVAILLREMIPDLDRWNILILATDINRDALDRARRGVYGRWSFRGTEDRVRDRYFHPQEGNRFAIDDQIRKLVTFEYLNLVADIYPSPANNTHEMDVILCRNVTIYFSPEVTQKVVNRFYRCLVEGGWLVTGAAEPNLLFYRDFQMRSFPGATVYQKTGEPAPSLPSALPNQWAAAQPAEEEPAADPYEQALRLVNECKWDEALNKLEEKIEQDPDFAPAYSLIGKVYVQKGVLDEARRWCEQALRKDKLQPEPYYLLAKIYERHGLLDMATEALKKALYLDRDFVLAHYSLAQLYRQQGKAHLARKSLENVRRLLQGRYKEEPLPSGNGLVAGRLLSLVETELTDGA